jgi:GNAT superfamily N-acetyltransferase
MRLRDAKRADLQAIVAMLADDPYAAARETPADPAPYEAAWAAIEASPAETVIVAEDDAGAVIGCLQLTLLPGLSRRGMTRALVEGVRVAAGRRGGGIGAALMAEAIARARAAGCGMVQLTTDLRRTDAHRFYERLGFVGSHLGMKLPL